jgi:AraC-like DNA-binding protein
MKPDRRPPFEEYGIRHWREYTRPYKDVLFLAFLMDDRVRWANHPRLSGFRVFSCGCYVEAWRHAWERKGLDEGVYIYCTLGRGFYRHGGRKWAVRAGDLLYCPPKTHHRYGAHEKDPWTIYWMHVSGDNIRQYSALLGLTPAHPVLRVGVRPQAVALFKMLFSLMRTPLDESRMLALQHGAQFLLTSFTQAAALDVVAPEQLAPVQRVMDFMEDHLDRPRLGLAELARLFGGSPSHFCRAFKRAAGHPPIEHFNRLKIRKACGYLATTGMRVKEIADRLGFDDPYYFSRVFRRLAGVPPAAYRAQVGERLPLEAP